MANPEHLAKLEGALDTRDLSSWNDWLSSQRQRNPDFSPDLSGADLPEAYFNIWTPEQVNLTKVILQNANLRGAHLRGVLLGGADLQEADLAGANLRSASLISANLKSAKLSDAILVEADLSSADLSDAIVRRANGYGANLDSSDLSEAIFTDATLRAARLRNADLTGSTLIRADLTATDLTEAYLGYADIREAYFRDTILQNSNFKYTFVQNTCFGRVDLSDVTGLEQAAHLGPSIIGIETIFRSHGNIPEVFLRGCGVPDTMIAFAKSLVGKSINFLSAFISYSSKDERFAVRLYKGLQGNGVRCWRFPEDAKGGESVWGEIDTSIRVHEKVLFLCSKHSLNSGPCLRELERALNREDKENCSILFPVALDRYLFDEWQHERRDDVLKKVVRDFTGWSRNITKYDTAFKQLLSDLKQPDKLITP